MKVIAPRIVTSDILASTNLVETDSVPHVLTTTYAKGARVRRVSAIDFVAGAATDTLPTGVTITRAGTTGTRTNRFGNSEPMAANTPRFDFDPNNLTSSGLALFLGLLVEPARTNAIINSSAFQASSWTRRGAFAASDASVIGPDGSTSASRWTGVDVAPSGDMYETAYAIGGRFPNSAPLALSLWAKRVSTTGVISIYNGSGPTSGQWNINLANMPSGMVRLTAAHPAVTVVYPFVANSGGAMGLQFAASAGAPLSLQVFGVQTEAIGAGERSEASTYVATSGAAATRNADQVVCSATALGLPNGSVTMRYTFDDLSTQDVATTIAGGSWTVPNNLNRARIRRIEEVGVGAVADGVRVYESLQPGNTGHALTEAAWWLDAGPTNRWAMFDGAVGSLSSATGSIAVTLKPDVAIDSLAVLEASAASVRVQITASGVGVYDQTKTAGAAPATLTFLGLPAVSNATVTVTIAGATGATPVSAGALLIGNLADLGLTEAGPSIGINDFSRRQTDDFGVTTVVARGWAKRMSLRSKVDTSAVADLQQRLTTLRALPSLWIGEDGYDSLVIYGFFKEFSVDLALETISYCTLTIEGMTTASDLDQDTTASGPTSVAYGTQITGLPAAIDPSNILPGGKIDAGEAQYGPGGPLISDLQPREAGSDKTITNTTVFNDVPDVQLSTTSAGAFVTGTFPFTVSVRLLKGGVDISDTATWSKTDSGVTSSINTATAGQKGDYTVTAKAGLADTLVTVKATVGAIDYFKQFKIVVATPPATTGGGGGGGGGGGSPGSPASTSGPFAAPGTGASVVAATLSAVTMGSAGTATIAVSLSFEQQTSSGSATDASAAPTTDASWVIERSVNGGAFATVTSGASSASAQKFYQSTVPKGTQNIAGTISASISETGRTSGDSIVYRLKLVGSPSTYGVTAISGTFSASPT